MIGVGLLSNMFGGGQGGGGFQMSSSATSSLSDRSPVNVAPIGVNFGAIMQPYGQGSPENGGIGADFMSRYSGASKQNLSASDIRSSNLLPVMLISGAGLVALLLFMR